MKFTVISDEEEFQRYQRVVKEYAEIQAWLAHLSGDDIEDE